jgi:CheY-like chemotaxis protein
MRVLCLDNDRDILEGMRSLLSRWGVEVQSADAVDTALALARNTSPDVLLVDYHLPGAMNGLAAIHALRTICGQDVPAALVTADGSDILLRAARDQGCPVLTKPLKPAALRAFLAAHRPVAPA